jgi:hypothetical protein
MPPPFYDGDLRVVPAARPRCRSPPRTVAVRPSSGSLSVSIDIEFLAERLPSREHENDLGSRST